jgi:serine/threonine protein kinase
MESSSISDMARHEGQLLQSLNHPNIIRCHAIHESDVQLVLELEYAEGEPLSEIIALGRKLPEPFIYGVVEQMASVLSYLSNERVLHFDIKPSNIIINDATRTLKLIDFGLAERTTETPPPYPRSAGTLWYTAPELLRSGPRSFSLDIWSLGMTLYQMAMRRLPPFAQQYIWRNGPPQIRGYSTQLRDLCTAMLNLDPIKRITGAEIPESYNPKRPGDAPPMQVLFRGDHEQNIERSVLLPITATAKDLLVYTNRHGMRGDKVSVNGEVITKTELLSNYRNGLFEIVGEMGYAGKGSELRARYCPENCYPAWNVESLAESAICLCMLSRSS